MDPEELLELIRYRRSIRKYSDKAIDENIIEALTEAGRWAPSAGNKQPLEIIIVDKEEIRQKLAEAAGRQSFIAEAPILFVIAAHWRRTAERYHDRGRTLYCLQDTAAAIQNILLLATAYGLGTCWIGAFNEDMVDEICQLPKGFRSVALIPIGYADRERPEDRGTPPRRKLEEFVYYNKYS